MKTLLIRTMCLPFLLATSAEADNRIKVNIKDPRDEGKVQEVSNVAGSVSDPKAKVWLVVKPQHASDCWIQTAAVVGSDGKWSVESHFGDKATHNERFEVIAIANPKNEQTHEGKTRCWPEAESKSKIVHVKRE